MSTNRKQWVAMLAKLVAPMAAPAAGKAMNDMLPLLADLPDAAFTLASLEHVASQCRRVPTYGELRSCLGNWWLANRPPQPAIAAPMSQADWRERYNIPQPREPATEAEMTYVGKAVRNFRMEMAARQVSAAIASVKPLRPAMVMTDRQLLATLEAQGAGNGHRATMLRAKLEKELTP